MMDCVAVVSVSFKLSERNTQRKEKKKGTLGGEGRRENCCYWARTFYRTRSSSSEWLWSIDIGQSTVNKTHCPKRHPFPCFAHILYLIHKIYPNLCSARFPFCAALFVTAWTRACPRKSDINYFNRFRLRVLGLKTGIPTIILYNECIYLDHYWQRALIDKFYVCREQ